jgi:hypothetical protein
VPYRGHVPATAVLSVDQHFVDPRTLHNEIYAEVECDGLPIRLVRYPLRINGPAARHSGSATTTSGVTPTPASFPPEEPDSNHVVLIDAVRTRFGKRGGGRAVCSA